MKNAEQVQLKLLAAIAILDWLPPPKAQAETAGTVRVCNLANAEAFLNILANGCELVGFCLFLFFLTKWVTSPARLRNKGMLAMAFGFLISGLSFPGLVNGAIAWARDANLFS